MQCYMVNTIDEVSIWWIDKISMHDSLVLNLLLIMVTGFEKSRAASIHNDRYLEMPILIIIWSIISCEETQMLAYNSPRFYSYS